MKQYGIETLHDQRASLEQKARSGNIEF